MVKKITAMKALFLAAMKEKGWVAGGVGEEVVGDPHSRVITVLGNGGLCLKERHNVLIEDRKAYVSNAIVITVNDKEEWSMDYRGSCLVDYLPFVKDALRVFLTEGLFHGGHSLCDEHGHTRDYTDKRFPNLAFGHSFAADTFSRCGGRFSLKLVDGDRTPEIIDHVIYFGGTPRKSV